MITPRMIDELVEQGSVPAAGQLVVEALMLMLGGK